MTPRAYYNEWEPYAAAWLRNLIAAGLIPAGDVDERSVTEVQASDLDGYTQCHFFAGIGGWPYALRLAGWPDKRSVWTASLPCQPFSAAGKAHGVGDERHLWPAFRRLVEVGAPPACFGEQVASAAGRGWLSGVRADLEAMGYAIGAADLCAASVGSPHIRQRLYWVADSENANGWTRERGTETGTRSDGERGRGPASGGTSSRVGDPQRAERRTHVEHQQLPGGREQTSGGPRCSGHVGGFWSDAGWLPCRDGKARSIKSGLTPLVNGIPFRLADGRTVEGTSRTGILRGLGNAIVPQVAAEFVMAYMECAELARSEAA